MVMKPMKTNKQTQNPFSNKNENHIKIAAVRY
jgi:hypothetical protein